MNDQDTPADPTAITPSPSDPGGSPAPDAAAPPAPSQWLVRGRLEVTVPIHTCEAATAEEAEALASALFDDLETKLNGAPLQTGDFQATEVSMVPLETP